ncbi:hypothetical protein ACHAXN_011435 [Cyclotella atomus]
MTTITSKGPMLPTLKAIVLPLTVLLLCASSSPAAAFVPPSHVGAVSATTTTLYGTIRFQGKAQADLIATIPLTLHDEYTTSNKTLSTFLSSSDSDAILLGMKQEGGVAQVTQLQSDTQSSTWECRQSSIEWFGMTLIPIFTNVIERNGEDGSIIISIVDAKTQVENGGKIGSALASAMRRSVFEGRNIVFWKEKKEDRSYTLVGDIELSLTINLPPFMPLPPGFNRIGSRIVERTCRERLRQNLRYVSDAYHHWAGARD